MGRMASFLTLYKMNELDLRLDAGSTGKWVAIRKTQAGFRYNPHRNTDPLHSCDSESGMATFPPELPGRFDLCEELRGLQVQKPEIPPGLNEFVKI